MREALAIRERSPGVSDTLVAATLTMLGRMEIDIGEFDLARQRLERAAAIHRAQPVPDGRGLANTLRFLWLAYNWLGEADQELPIAAEALEELRSAGVDPSEVTYHRWAEMRLEGQYHEIEVPLPDGELDASQVPAIQAAFKEAYTRRYGRMLEGLPIEALQWRLTATGPERAVQLRRQEADGGEASEALKGTRPVYFEGHGMVETPVYDRERLRPGMCFPGPAIVEERESTCVIHPGDTVRVDEFLSLVVSFGSEQGTTEGVGS